MLVLEKGTFLFSKLFTVMAVVRAESECFRNPFFAQKSVLLNGTKFFLKKPLEGMDIGST